MEGKGDFDDAVVWTLGQEALGLLDALIERTITLNEPAPGKAQERG